MNERTNERASERTTSNDHDHDDTKTKAKTTEHNADGDDEGGSFVRGRCVASWSVASCCVAQCVHAPTRGRRRLTTYLLAGWWCVGVWERSGE